MYIDNTAFMKKKMLGKAKKACCALASVLLSLYVVIGFFGGFNLKCPTFKSWYLKDFYHQEIDNIQEVCGRQLAENERFQIQINLNIDRENDKHITTKYVNTDGEDVNIQCEMGWFWGDNYTWSIVD